MAWHLTSTQRRPLSHDPHIDTCIVHLLDGERIADPQAERDLFAPYRVSGVAGTGQG
jgi:hypothetical protein